MEVGTVDHTKGVLMEAKRPSEGLKIFTVSALSSALMEVMEVMEVRG